MAIDGDYVVMVDGGHGDFDVVNGDCGHGLVIVGADGFVVGFCGSGCWRWFCCFGGGTASGLVIVVGDCDGSVRNSSWLKHRKQEWQELSLASCLQFDCFLFIKMCHWASVRQCEDG